MSIPGLRSISPFEWEIPTNYRADMRVPVRLFMTEALLNQASRDHSIDQAVNVATLPGLAGPVAVMPDMHQGYGFPIGGVAATDASSGAISPGGVGYDIGCGVRLMTSAIPLEEAKPRLADLANALYAHCPVGVSAKGGVPLTRKDLEQVCREGARWTLAHGYASEDDLRRTEESGSLEGGDPGRVSELALERGQTQLGTLGAGNHFIEVDVVDSIFDADSARQFGLREGCLVLQIHCGSRGFGHQICTDYVQSFQGVAKKYGITLPDRELMCAPLDTPEGQAYLAAMRAAGNFAFANRQVLAAKARQAFEEGLRGIEQGAGLSQVYDIAHNMAKMETHQVDGKKVKVCVHRKGATRAFGPGAYGLPEEYRHTGQPVLVPGSMGTASWVLAGTEGSMERSWGSTCHGAGRVMSRSQAKKHIQGEDLRRDLQRGGIQIRAGSLAGLAEEAPEAYKDVDMVVETVEGAGIARKVARLRPVIVVKG